MAGGVIETVRGCTEKCYLLPGHPAVPRLPHGGPGKRKSSGINQLQEFAADGLIHSGRNGKFQLSSSPMICTPRLHCGQSNTATNGWSASRAWKPATPTAWPSICQARAEVGQDPELAHAPAGRHIGMGMLYLGVESRQRGREPGGGAQASRARPDVQNDLVQP